MNGAISKRGCVHPRLVAQRWCIFMLACASVRLISGSEPVVSSNSFNGFVAGLVDEFGERFADDITPYCNDPILYLKCEVEQASRGLVEFLQGLFAHNRIVHPSNPDFVKYCVLLGSSFCTGYKAYVIRQIEELNKLPNGKGLTGTAHVQYESGVIRGKVAVDVAEVLSNVKEDILAFPKAIESVLKLRKVVNFSKIYKASKEVKETISTLKETIENWTHLQKDFCEGCNGQCLNSIPGKGLCKKSEPPPPPRKRKPPPPKRKPTPAPVPTPTPVPTMPSTTDYGDPAKCGYGPDWTGCLNTNCGPLNCCIICAACSVDGGGPNSGCSSPGCKQCNSVHCNNCPH